MRVSCSMLTSGRNEGKNGDGQVMGWGDGVVVVVDDECYLER